MPESQVHILKKKLNKDNELRNTRNGNNRTNTEKINIKYDIVYTLCHLEEREEKKKTPENNIFQNSKSKYQQKFQCAIVT